jgi:cysteinyl-tRNA synthetase
MLHVHNTLTNQLEPFTPLEPGKVKMYVCGPTVYGGAHIGHALSYIQFDMIRRYLEWRRYAVTHVQNFTDVDDKIINRANQTGEPWQELTSRYIADFLEQMDALNVQRAHAYPHASQEIPHMISMIEGLVEQGYAYASDGDVYFRVLRDADYGKLSNQRLDQQQAGLRAIVAGDKEHAKDFALWKAAKPGEPAWDSPWGPGRPGWHIECSAINLHHLGPQIDIHGGGTDLIFPHHENEIAQTESYTGQPFARYWLHNGLLQLGEEKMSRSVGNLIGINELLQQYDADVYRLFVLSSHYRRPVTFRPDVLETAQRGLERLKTALRPAARTTDTSDPDRLAAVESIQAAFEAAMDEDFNAPKALGFLFDFVRVINTWRDDGQIGPAFEQAQARVRHLLGILGFRLDDRSEPARHDIAPFVDLLIDVRLKLREAKQWELADEIRDRLETLGVVLQDTPTGTEWQITSPREPNV